MIKSTTKLQQTYNFPCIKVYNSGSFKGLIVLFDSFKSGTVINFETIDTERKNRYPIGCYLTDWDADFFVDYNNPITLQNS